MKQLYFLGCLFILVTSVNSQSNLAVGIESDLSINNNRVYSISSFDKRDNSFKGSPLLWDEWMYASILLEGNSEYSDKQYIVNYDALAKQLYVKIGKNIYSMILEKVNSLSVFTSIESPTIFRAVSDKDHTRSLYRVIYQDDELQLLSLVSAKIGKAYYNTALDAGSVKPSLLKSETLFIYKGDRLFELPKKRKKLLEKYAGEEEMKEVVAFFKTKRVALKNEEEVQSALIELNKTK